MDFLKILSRRVGESIGEQNSWLSYWLSRLSVVIRRAVAVAIDSRHKKAVAASPAPPRLLSPLENVHAHLLAVPQLGASNPTFEAAGSFFSR